MPAHQLESVFESLRREFESGSERARDESRAETLKSLNEMLRRLRQYKDENEWIQTTLDAASGFAEKVAIFSVERDSVRLRAQNPAGQFAGDLTFALSAAAAFASVVDSKEPVTALRRENEVSAGLSSTVASERAYLFPVSNGSRISAIVFASGEAVELNGLELVAGLASSVLERAANTGLHAQIAAATPKAETEQKPAAVEKPAMQMPSWEDLNVEQRNLHIRAQRFARVAVAEIQLARPEACKAAREQGDLYLFLKREIDKARENFSRQFMTVPSMVDYLHLELVHTAAEGDERKLGADYPGRLG